MLKFTPLEFETVKFCLEIRPVYQLKFTPLEFETVKFCLEIRPVYQVKIYSVGV
ncbi:hypothetical protein CAMRE0001_1320 [Campylobacter rectus RM3267]|uniref:Uncharacterized protein n=1 Tax=Campylobacter rectus RM3267 TaxID=553218 RepID=B9D011_CAMRE|nr:hypothetical protein CAMRE0001_1320 [Campylobacter rectus RM3267]